MPIRVIITVRGGLVQEVRTNLSCPDGMYVSVIDYDGMEQEEEDPADKAMRESIERELPGLTVVW